MGTTCGANVGNGFAGLVGTGAVGPGRARTGVGVLATKPPPEGVAVRAGAGCDVAATPGRLVGPGKTAAVATGATGANGVANTRGLSGTSGATARGGAGMIATSGTSGGGIRLPFSSIAGVAVLVGRGWVGMAAAIGET